MTSMQSAHDVVLDHGVADALAGVAASVAPDDVVGSVPAVEARVAAVVGKYAHAAYALAVEHYRSVRADAGVRGSFTVPPLRLAPPSKIASTVGWAVKPLFGASPDAARAQANLVSGAGWLVLNTGRSTVLNAVHADPKAHGWVRVPEAVPCAYCALQAVHGAVPRSDRSMVFHAHTSCRCLASPTFAPYEFPGRVAAWRQLYLDSTPEGGRLSSRDWARVFNAGRTALHSA